VDHEEVLVDEAVAPQRCISAPLPMMPKTPPGSSRMRATALTASGPSSVEFGHARGSRSVVEATYFRALFSASAKGTVGDGVPVAEQFFIVLDQLRRSPHPEAAYLATFQRGKQVRHPANRPGAPVFTN
jgi:hypothetical protein